MDERHSLVATTIIRGSNLHSDDSECRRAGSLPSPGAWWILTVMWLIIIVGGLSKTPISIINKSEIYYHVITLDCRMYIVIIFYVAR